MKRVMGVVIPVALLALAACGGGTHDSGASGGGASGGGTSGGGVSGGGGSGGSGGSGTTTPPAATAPSISTQPLAQNVTAPAAATFVVAASGTDPLSFQWRSSVNGTDWTNISGATSASYDTGATDGGSNGRYYSVVVSNSAGSVTSASVQLTVSSPPSGGGGGSPPSDGSLQPLAGAADPFPHTVAPLVAGSVAAGPMQNQGIISWDPQASGFNLGLTHLSGAQTRLFLPGGVFRDEVFIRLTEITGVGPQVTTVLAAVRIEPGDLLPEKTITATFTIPDTVMATVDVSQMIGFAADSDGSNLHLMPIVTGTLGTQASRPGIKLGRLGIVGIAVATPQQQAALAAAWPTEPDDQLDAALAPEVTANWRKSVQPLATSTSTRNVKILAADAPSESPLLAPLRGYFNDTVVPAFAAAYGDPTLIPAAIQTGFAFIRNAQLSGLAEADAPLAGVVADLSARIDTLIDKYADYVAEQCRTVGGPPQLQAMLGTLRTLMLMGHGSKADEIDDVLSQCSHFKATFKHDYTRVGHGTSGGAAIDETVHTIVEASTTFGLNEATMLSPMRLTTAELDRTRPYGSGGSIHSTWTPDPYTSTWGVHSLSVPVLRTKGAPASTSVVLTLNGFNGFPFQATETTVSPAGTSSTPGVTVGIPFSVPALPKIDGTPANYGPMLIPASGSVSSESTRTVPYDGGGSATEHQRVEVTLERG